MRRARKSAGILAAVLVAAAVTAIGGPSLTSPAGAEPGGCSNPKPNGDCPVVVERPVTRPGQPVDSGGTGGNDDDDNGGGGGPTEPDPNRCEWHTYPNQAHWRTVFPEAPPDAIFGESRCFVNGLPVYGPYVPQWTTPGDEAAPPPPTPAEVAQALWINVQALLRQPEVATDPPDGEPSIIDIPTFVEVTNWQGRIERSQCLLGVCVDLVAEPTLTFAPGEPGSESIECAPPGTRFDPNGPEPDVQATADGACVHTYQRRTGVAGRPEAWTAEVTVTWEVTWQGGGDQGVFDPIALTETVPRPVDEVTTVVADVGSGGRG
jgi:hypothetical protein